MNKIIDRLKVSFPALCFTPGQQFCWSPETSEIFYVATAHDKKSVWSLLHETGHALLKHNNYQADIELLRLEIDAWLKARQLAIDLGIHIDEDHIQDCLDTYRDWLYKRSICPNCTSKCLQQEDFVHYRCFNCHKIWRVSSSRFCRAYRRHKNIPQTAVFHLDNIY